MVSQRKFRIVHSFHPILFQVKKKKMCCKSKITAIVHRFLIHHCKINQLLIERTLFELKTPTKWWVTKPSKPIWVIPSANVIACVCAIHRHMSFWFKYDGLTKGMSCLFLSTPGLGYSWIGHKSRHHDVKWYVKLTISVECTMAGAEHGLCYMYTYFFFFVFVYIYFFYFVTIMAISECIRNYLDVKTHPQSAEHTDSGW